MVSDNWTTPCTGFICSTVFDMAEISHVKCKWSKTRNLVCTCNIHLNSATNHLAFLLITLYSKTFSHFVRLHEGGQFPFSLSSSPNHVCKKHQLANGSCMWLWTACLGLVSLESSYQGTRKKTIERNTSMMTSQCATKG